MRTTLNLTLFLFLAVANASPDGRIVGGVPAEIGEFPYQVSIRENGEHFCGGAIINSYWILTAAHCLCDDYTNIKIAAGFVNDRNHGSDYQEKNIMITICHEKYNAELNDYDIALGKVEPKFDFGEHVSSIELPPSSSYVLPQLATVSGWGAKNEDDPMSDLLLKLNVKIFPWDTCNEIYEDDFSDLLICAGYMEGGKDTCQGDSGGPLTCSNAGDRVLCGLVAAGQGCARPGFPGIYTPTYKYLDWIRKKME